MSAWMEMERVVLLGTRRESVQLPEIAPALDQLLSTLQNEEAEHALLSAAGTLDLYEQIGRALARLKPESDPALPRERLLPCPPEAASLLAQMLDSSLRLLLPEFLNELQKAGMRLPEVLLPNMLALGIQRSKSRSLILPVLGRRGRWLAALNPAWQYAALNPASWSSIRAAWDETAVGHRSSLVAQLRVVDPAQGRALVESTWRGENDQRRLPLIKQLAIGLSMADEPLLEVALDDRSRMVRRNAAELLAHLLGSRLCQRMISYVPRYLAWTPQETRKITVSLPDVSAAMRRDGIVGSNSKVAARVRSQEIIQLVGAVPLTHWEEAWQADPRSVVQAIPSTSWPRTLTAALSTAAQRQKNAVWARALIDEFEITPLTGKLIPVLAAGDVYRLTTRALGELDSAELPRNGTLVTIMRRWPGVWDAALGEQLVRAFSGHFQLTRDAKNANNTVREVFMKLARTADPALLSFAAGCLGDLEALGCWRSTAVEFLHILRFRRDMLAALRTEERNERKT